ncbi:RNA recognition motif domain-containing protein [Thiolapillus sp.]|uniref:RNA recognition motif domain-containing protein n=2 Tax=Thiolapillus sp. TaxID=2017437 RepID=UPI0025EBD317|nr:RNA-binding protein [Thiolapillus sp.]
MHISISGFPPDTTIEELREPLEEYGAVIRDLTIEPSNNEDNYIAMVDVDTDDTGCKILAEKINGRIWKGKKLRARHFLFIK